MEPGSKTGSHGQEPFNRAELDLAVKDLRDHQSQSYAELLSGQPTQATLFEINSGHMDLLSRFQSLFDECQTKANNGQVQDLKVLKDSVMKESSEFCAWVRRLLLDLEETRSHHISRSSVKTSASSARRAEVKIELAKKRVEMAKAKEMAELQARMDELQRQKELECLEAEAKALDELEENQGEQNELLSKPLSESRMWNSALQTRLGCVETREDQLRNETSSSVVQMLRRQTAFGTQIRKFSGDPLQFMHFLRTVEDVIEKNLDDQRSRLHRLLEVVEGDPRDLIDGCVFLGDDLSHHHTH